MKKEIPVLLLTGYLGSGKTTLLNYILSNRQGLKAAVIVNDIGEVNIDASLIQRGGIVGQDKESNDLIALQNGCICCTLSVDLARQIAELSESGCFDYIVIEASGICEPAPIAQTICSMPMMEEEFHRTAVPRLDCIATVVDALRLRDEFSCGESLKAETIGDDDIENLIIDQIEFCNVIILNKSSEISPEELGRVHAIIGAIQPKARIIETDYCKININDIIDTRLFDFEKVATSATWIQRIEGHDSEEHDHHEHHHHDHDHDHDHDCTCHHCHHHHGDGGEAEEYGIETMVYYRRPGFNLNRFDWFVAREWPANIIRTKGLVYFSHNDDMSYIFEQAGRQKKLTQAGLWYATAPAEELERLMATEPGLAADWDPTYGDRMIKLVIIGQHLDRPAITAALDRCLR